MYIAGVYVHEARRMPGHLSECVWCPAVHTYLQVRVRTEYQQYSERNDDSYHKEARHVVTLHTPAVEGEGRRANLLPTGERQQDSFAFVRRKRKGSQGVRRYDPVVFPRAVTLT